MKCEFCGCLTTINWGNNCAVLCEDHKDRFDDLAELKSLRSDDAMGKGTEFEPAILDITMIRLSRIWWSFTWRYLCVFAIMSVMVNTLLTDVLKVLIAHELLKADFADTIESVVLWLIPLLTVYVVFERMLGKKIGSYRLVLVNARAKKHL